MKTYKGIREKSGCYVTVDGRSLPLCLEIRNHSPTGFEWGYGGSGPAQLALAILHDHFQGDRQAVQELYQHFKFGVISGFKGDEWTLTSDDIDKWVEAGQL